MRLNIFLILFLLCASGNAQDLFKIGMGYYEKDNYLMADSLFTLQLKKFPTDRNLRFNRGAVKLCLKDTCAFCKDMEDVYHAFRDKDAGNLFFSFCCKADTLYFDKNYLRSNKEHYRYYEIIEHNKYASFRYCEVHDKKSKGETVILNRGNLDGVKTDIIATYKAYGDTSKIYSFTLTPPSFGGNEDAKLRYLHNSPYFNQAMNDLKLHHIIVYVAYIVDKNGRIRNIKVLGTNSKIDKMEDLTNYTTLIISNMPPLVPAKFRDENVDYMMNDFISFW